jgi:hypothetical protein
MSRHSKNLIESQLKQIDEIFRTHSNNEPHVVTIVDVKKDKSCDFHGKAPSLSRRGSVDITKSANNINSNGFNSRKGSISSTSNNASNFDSKRSFCSTEKLNEKLHNKKGRNSIASFTELVNRNLILDDHERYQMRRESMPVLDVKRSSSSTLDTWNKKLFKGMEHPSNFPSTLRSSKLNGNKSQHDTSRRASSNWNVNHFHNYTNNGTKTNLDRKHSISVSEKIFKRDYAHSTSPEPKKELHSILKHNGSNNTNNNNHNGSSHNVNKRATVEDDLKEIIKRLSFDYIEKEMSQNGHKIDVDLLSNSDSSSGDNGRTSTKLTPRRISIDSLESSSRRSSRRFSDFSVNSDDLVMFKSRANKTPVQVSSNVLLN